MRISCPHCNKELDVYVTPVKETKETIENPDKPQNVTCPDCGGEMVSRKGSYGMFWGCKKYPDCRGTRDSMGRSRAEREAEKESERNREPKHFGWNR